MKTAGIIGLLTAFTSSFCCITPLLALMGGFGGMATSLSWLEPLRPYTIALSVGALGWAWYAQLKPKPALTCCNTPITPFWQMKRFLGLMTGAALLLLTFPVYSDLLSQVNQPTSNQIEHSSDNQQIAYVMIKGMTCSGCEQHVKTRASKLKGITDVKGSYSRANAVVRFNPQQTTIDAIQKAVAATGYKVRAVKTTQVK